MKKKFIIFIAVGVLLTGAAAWLSAAPTIGAITVSPTSIEVGTSTAVTVTTVIADPSVIPTGVNLLRVGTPTMIVGQFKDDGTSGDLKSGDKIFTTRLNITGQTLGEVRLQISAAFKGMLARVMSDPITVRVTSSNVISPTGGSLSFPSGVRFTVPAGSLTRATTFEVTPVTAAQLPAAVPAGFPVQAAVAIQPQLGGAGSSPATDAYTATITLPLFKPLSPGTALMVLRLNESGDNFSNADTMAVVDPNGRTATFTTDQIGLLIIIRAQDLGTENVQ